MRAPSVELGQAAQVATLLGDTLLEEHPGDADAGRVVVARAALRQTDISRRVRIQHAALPAAPAEGVILLDGVFTAAAIATTR
eukprot:8721832-Alexandrium_andersonii.AAC.1